LHFLAAEHGMLIVQLTFQGIFDPESKTLREVKDLNRDIEDELLGSAYQSAEVPETTNITIPLQALPSDGVHDNGKSR
jgi:hypothetical protein